MFVHGLRDETGHLLTAYVWALGLMALRLPLRLGLVVLGGIVIDIDHVLQLLDIVDAAPGSSRPVSHSLMPVMILFILASVDRRRVWVWMSVAVGFTSHLARDMATGTVPLLWPLPVEPVSIRYRVYAGTLVACAMIAFGTALVNRRRMWNDVD